MRPRALLAQLKHHTQRVTALCLRSSNIIPSAYCVPRPRWSGRRSSTRGEEDQEEEQDDDDNEDDYNDRDDYDDRDDYEEDYNEDYDDEGATKITMIFLTSRRRASRSHRKKKGCAVPHNHETQQGTYVLAAIDAVANGLRS